MELQPDAPPAPVPSERDWSELPLDVLTSVFAGLGAVDVLIGAGFVCHSWLEAAKAPELWRKVDMGRGPRDKEVMGKNRGVDLDDPNRGVAFAYPVPGQKYMRKSTRVMCAMAKVAVDRSDGKLEVFVGEDFVTDEILNYIGARSPSLKGLALASCYEITSEGFTALVNKCPMLEDIELSACVGLYGDAIVTTGKACLHLKRLVLDRSNWRRREFNVDAIGISRMHELRHLSLVCNEITNEELMAIVDSCPCLEHLSLIGCYNIVVDDVLRAKCATVKTLELRTSQDYHSDSQEYDDQEFGAGLYRSWRFDDYGHSHNYGIHDDLDPDYYSYADYDYER